MLRVLCVVSFIFLFGCAGIKPLSQQESLETSGLYSDTFLTQISDIKNLYKNGENKKAMSALTKLDNLKLSPAELAFKRNLMGVILFTDKLYEKAIERFQMALTTSEEDVGLSSQIYLNLASSYFKLSMVDKAYSTLKNSDPRTLNEGEVKKFHQLGLLLSNQLQKDQEATDHLVRLLGTFKTLEELRASPFFLQLQSKFAKFDKFQKLKLLEDFESSNFLVVAYLGYIEAEKRYYNAEKSEALDILEWLKSHFEDQKEVIKLVGDFEFRLENFSKINPSAIGIILPFSGERDKFAKRAMRGIDSAMHKIYSGKLQGVIPPKLIIRDSKGSGVVGAHAVKELIEKHYVSVIIGGIFSDEAKKEYLEARKHGVFFISLSQVYVPRSLKSHLLLEIPGSVESQVKTLLSKKVMEGFGKKGAIIFPNTSRGDAYIDEFWQQARSKGIDVVGVQKYDAERTDHRESVEKLLGLRFKRERKEELELWSQIYSLQKSRGARRIQTLAPITDFDWIYLPAFPNEALQLIPAFSYYDAFNVTFIGGPSWRSKALAKGSYKYGKLHFVGDDIKEKQEVFSKDFQSKYNYRPRLIETVAYDAMKITGDILTSLSFSKRDELELHIRSKETFKGISGDWTFNDGIWLKDMALLTLNKGKIEDIFDESQTKEAETQTN